MRVKVCPVDMLHQSEERVMFFVLRVGEKSGMGVDIVRDVAEEVPEIDRAMAPEEFAHIRRGEFLYPFPGFLNADPRSFRISLGEEVVLESDGADPGNGPAVMFCLHDPDLEE